MVLGLLQVDFMKQNILNKSLALLTPKEKIRGLIVLFLAVIMALFEVVGVASVVPFLTILANPALVNENVILFNLYNFFEFNEINDFLVFLGTCAFLLIIIASVVRTIGQYALTRFAQMRRHSLASRLLKRYIYKNYTFFLTRNSSELSKIILSEVDQVINGVFQPSAIMVGQIFTACTSNIFIYCRSFNLCYSGSFSFIDLLGNIFFNSVLS